MNQLTRSFRLAETPGEGFACDEAGLLLGDAPLLERDAVRGWRPRALAELNAVVCAACGLPVDLTTKLGGLAAVARALNQGDVTLARIAAVQLQLPDLPQLAKGSRSIEEITSLAYQLLATRVLAKEWDETQHNRWPAGSPDSQGGRFAPGDAGGAAGIASGGSGGSSRPEHLAAPAKPASQAERKLQTPTAPKPRTSTLTTDVDPIPPLSLPKTPSFATRMAAQVELKIRGLDNHGGNFDTSTDAGKFADAMGMLAAGQPVRDQDMTPEVRDWLNQRQPEPILTAPEYEAQYEKLQALLLKDENIRHTVYNDSLGHPTVGIGHKVTAVDGLSVGDTISDARIAALYEQDATTAFRAALSQASAAGITEPSFITFLASVNFEDGAYWTAEFPVAWSQIKNGEYAAAAANLGASKWAREAPNRVQEFQAALLALPPKQSR